MYGTLIYKTTRCVFAFTQALCWKEILFFVPAFAEVFYGILGLSCNCFLSWYSLCSKRSPTSRMKLDRAKEFRIRAM